MNLKRRANLSAIGTSVRSGCLLGLSNLDQLASACHRIDLLVKTSQSKLSCSLVIIDVRRWGRVAEAASRGNSPGMNVAIAKWRSSWNAIAELLEHE
jgi:hypothetical protein